jgi:hypothetical protein
MEEVLIKKAGQENLRVRKTVYWIEGVLEVLFACRFVLKILGANPQGVFVSVIYNVSQWFLFPFTGIFGSAAGTGIETKAILEPGTIIGMIVYALIAWGIITLIKIGKTSRNTGTM